MSMQGQKGNLSKRDTRALGQGGKRITTSNPADPSLVGRNTKRGGSTGATKATRTAIEIGEFGGRPKTFGKAGNTHTS